jgi:hypothetical protein
MSFLDHAKRVMSEVASMTRRGSAPPELNNATPGPPSSTGNFPRRNRHERKTISLPYEATELSEFLIDETVSLKINPYKYPFLNKSDPLINWEETTTAQESNELEAVNQAGIEHKVFRNKSSGALASVSILFKFSDDVFDDYLFEIGILTECLPKFGDYIKEIEILRECKSHRNIITFCDAYYFDSKLWVSSFLLLISLN